MSTPIASAAALALFTAFMAVALLTVAPSNPAPAEHVATAAAQPAAV